MKYWKRRNKMNVGEVVSTIVSLGVKVVIAIFALLFAFRLINLIMKKLEEKLYRRADLDKTVFSAIFYGSRILLKAFVLISVIAYLGVDVSGITALIASLGVGVGLAVNGALSNLAGGVLLLITRPCKIDDFIEADGFSGTVEDIRVTFTRLRTPDNKVVYIPNGKLSTDTLINFSEKPIRRLDLTFTVSYDSRADLAMQLIADVIAENSLALNDPEPNINISDYKDSGIEIIVRPWVRPENYWQLKFELLDSIGKSFRKEGIVIPYNQIDVHIKEK
jgi:small conductance mechanosensitive channel